MIISKDIINDIIIKHNIKHTWIVDRLIFLHLGGSRLYGTNDENSDIDIRGVTIAPKSYWIGASSFESIEVKEENLDIVIYDIRKFLKLYVNMSPNIIESVFADSNEDSIIYTTQIWNTIKHVCKRLVSKKVYNTLSGYASSQLNKLIIKQNNKSGRQYIINKYGFDTKFAMHATRLLHQGEEILLTQSIKFPRENAAELKLIRNGTKYSPDQLENFLADMLSLKSRLDKALLQTKLPEKPNYNEYERLLDFIYDNHVHTS